ncbi:MAG: hypothetical protein KDA17_07760 [Candidatus Saccharibacteria bacterium]|nr:hypothetical protein [Candidatus Saccharibacteria bacterium]
MPISAEEAQAKVRAVFGTVVDAKPLHEPISDDSDADVVDLITRVCYFYPQYTLETAEQLTSAQVTALLLQAEKQKAIEYYNHALIAAAPHSKKGAMVNKLIKQYRKIIGS